MSPDGKSYPASDIVLFRAKDHFTRRGREYERFRTEEFH
jgi:hypothetical protein